MKVYFGLFFVQVSQSRLEARSHRPDVELCRDPVHHRLVEEVGQIQESVDLLNRTLHEAGMGRASRWGREL